MYTHLIDVVASYNPISVKMLPISGWYACICICICLHVYVECLKHNTQCMCAFLVLVIIYFCLTSRVVCERVSTIVRCVVQMSILIVCDHAHRSTSDPYSDVYYIKLMCL